MKVLSIVFDPWLVAGGVVLLHAVVAFSTPPTNRASTTPGRYYAAMAAYALVMLFLYVLVGKTPGFLNDVLPNSVSAVFGEVPHEPQHQVQTEQPSVVATEPSANSPEPTKRDNAPTGRANWSAPFFAALFVTVLLPIAPLLCQFENWLRGFLQDLAAIPYRAMRMSRQLRAAELRLTDFRRKEVTNLMVSHGFAREAIVFERNETAEGLWWRISTLISEVRQWDEHERRLAGFRRIFRDEHRRLEHRYEQLFPKVNRLLPLVPLPGDDARVRDAIDELRVSFLDQATQLYKELTEFISRAVLYCRLTAAARTDELRRIGFDVQRSEGWELFDRIVPLFLIFALYFEISLAVEGPEYFSLPRRLVLGLMISATYCFAVLWALYFQRQERDARPNSGRPWTTYVLAAGVAGLSSAGCSFALHLFFEQQIEQALREMVISWTWALLAMTTAFVTAFHCDNRTSHPAVRWVEALSQACVTGATAFAVQWLLDRQCNDTAVVAVLGRPCQAPPVERLVRGGAIVGLLVGIYVPAWFRRSRLDGGDRAEPRDDDPGLRPHKSIETLRGGQNPNLDAGQGRVARVS